VPEDGRAAAASSRPLTPSAARRRLGEELRSIREEARLSLTDAAAGIERSAATLSRLENARTVPRLLDVRTLIAHYRKVAPDVLLNGTEERIIDLAETARQHEWFASFRDVLAGELTSDEARRYVEYESDATFIRSFEPELVPGLLQTPEYAAAVTQVFFPERTADERARLVDFRMGRQRILEPEAGAIAFEVVVGEAAIRRTIGPPGVMRRQLEVLINDLVNGRSNVTIRIVPISVSIPAVFGGPFAVLDLSSPDEPGLVYLEGREGSQFMPGEEQIARYRALFDELLKAALSAAETRGFLEDEVTRLG
jgi:transcriptional regulator with XRE-family HTH domain